MNKAIQLLVAALLVCTAGTAHSLGPSVIDTEALAMGGAGVSSANENLGNINPALVGAASRSDDEFFMTPTLFYLDYDINDFSKSLNNFQNNPNANTLKTLESGSIFYNWGAAFGVILHSHLAVSTVFLNSYSQTYSQLQLVDNDLKIAAGSGVPYNSVIEVSGLSIIEAGVTHTSSSSWRFAGIGEVKWGVSGKMLTGVAHQEELPVETAEVDGFFDEGVSSQGLTFDLGVLKEWGRDWAAGVAIKNIYPVKFALANGDSYSFGPHIKVGGTYIGYRHRISVDLDLLKSKPFGTYGETQILALGTDYDIGGYLKLRAGLNFDIQRTIPETYTVGVGVNSQYFQISLALIGHSGAINGLGLQTTIGF